jgi:hypothetical protein
VWLSGPVPIPTDPAAIVQKETRVENKPDVAVAVTHEEQSPPYIKEESSSDTAMPSPEQSEIGYKLLSALDWAEKQEGDAYSYLCKAGGKKENFDTWRFASENLTQIRQVEETQKLANGQRKGIKQFTASGNRSSIRVQTHDRSRPNFKEFEEARKLYLDTEHEVDDVFDIGISCMEHLVCITRGSASSHSDRGAIRSILADGDSREGP